MRFTFLPLCLLIISFQAFPQMPENFYVCWKAANEEYDSKTKIQTYRPCSHQFGPSMFRHYMDFKKEGTCLYLQPSPTDAHYEVKGTWFSVGKEGPVTIYDNNRKVVLKFKIIQLEKDLLKMQTE